MAKQPRPLILSDARSAGKKAFARVANEGNSLLHIAAAQCNRDRINELICSGADINETNQAGKTPIDLVPDFGSSEGKLRHCAETTLDALISGGSVSLKWLRRAVQKKDVDRAGRLIANGTSVCPPNHPDLSLLVEAVHHDAWFPMLDLLVKAGCNPNQKATYKEHPYLCAIPKSAVEYAIEKLRRLEVVNFLIQHGADIGYLKPPSGETHFMYFFPGEDYQRFLSAHSIAKSDCEKDRDSLLHLTAKH